MKPDNLKALLALHAQCSAMVSQLESIIDAEHGEEGCPHENFEDHSLFGMKAQEHLYCLDCKQYFSKEE
jgi:hypothetical protein